MDPAVARALRPFGTSVFTGMTALALRHGAINLSQGFPDFDGPEEIREVAADAIRRGPNQYAPSNGIPELRAAIARKTARFTGVELDPEAEVTVTAGATEGLAASLLGLLDPGDEVVVLEPSYDLYAPVVARAGARPVYVSLERPSFRLEGEALARAFSPRTRAIIINNPQNPCGKVFTDEELGLVANLCVEHGAVAIGDEVYEHLVYDGRRHRTLLSVPGLRERAIVVSSTAKTFSMTGWKVGYATACPRLTEAVRAAHQFLTYATPGAFQLAMARAMDLEDAYYVELLASYSRRRLLLCGALERMGLRVLWPEGTYFASIEISGLGLGDDLEFCEHLAAEVGVAAIPTSFFYEGRRRGRDLVRLCFCKREETLTRAIERLEQRFGSRPRSTV